MNQFKETYDLFKNALDGYRISTYIEWMLIPDDLKAAALYVNFYDQITLAWYKVFRPFIDEDTAISTLMQYLMKTVSIIQKNSKRYSPNYIYTVAYNALIPLARIKRDIERYDAECNLYDYILELERQCDDDPDNNYYWEPLYADRVISEDTSEDAELSEVWNFIESCDYDTKKVIEFLVGGRKLGKKLSAKAPSIIAELRIKLCKYNK